MTMLMFFSLLILSSAAAAAVQGAASAENGCNFTALTAETDLVGP